MMSTLRGDGSSSDQRSLASMLERLDGRAVEVLPADRTAHSSREVVSVTEINGADEESVRIRALIPGLYGALSVGPPGIDDELDALEAAGDHRQAMAVRSFLDVLHVVVNRHLIRRMFGARLVSNWNRPRGAAVERFVRAIGGCDHPEPARWARFRRAARPEGLSTANMTAALRVMFANDTVRVTVVPAMTLPVPSRCFARFSTRSSVGARLGASMLAGRFVAESRGRICIRMEMEMDAEVRELLRDGPIRSEMLAALHRVVPRSVPAELELVARSSGGDNSAERPESMFARTLPPRLGFGARLTGKSPKPLSVRVPVRQ